MARKASAQEIPEPPDDPPAALDTIDVPIHEGIEDFVKDTEWAIKLGKALRTGR